MKKTSPRALILLASMMLLARSASAQTVLTLDGTSGSMTTSSDYSTTGGLDLSLGFFVNYLVVGGGGGNGGGVVNSAYPGGGGGGAVETGTYQIEAQSYSLTVGAGGTGGGNGNGTGGGSTSLFGVTATGGAAGSTGAAGVGGASGAGYAGGTPASGPSNGRQGGGGGGAGGVGGNGVYVASPLSRIGGTGGVGITSSITGTSLMYGFGGGGGAPGGNFQNGDGTTNQAPRANSGGGGSGAGTGSGPGAAGTVIVSYAGSAAGTGGTITAGTGSAAGNTIQTFTSTGASTLNFSSVNMNTRLGTTATGLISGSGNVTYNGPGRLTLTNANTYTGTTTVTGGQLYVNGNQAAATGATTVQSGAVLGGTGTIGGGTTVQSGATIRGGDASALGNLTINGNVVLNGGGNYNWQMADAAAGAGTGWSHITATGALDLSGLNSSDAFAINLASIVSGQTGGAAANFNPDQDGVWTILTANGGIEDFNALDFQLNLGATNGSSGFSNSLDGGTFKVVQNGDNLNLVFTSTPEPKTVLMLLLGLATLAFLGRKKQLA